MSFFKALSVCSVYLLASVMREAEGSQRRGVSCFLPLHAVPVNTLEMEAAPRRTDDHRALV